MPVNIGLLGGQSRKVDHVAGATSTYPGAQLSKKKHTYRPVYNHDRQAWVTVVSPNGETEIKVPVFRSWRTDAWLDRAAFDAEVAEIKDNPCKAILFSSRRGFAAAQEVAGAQAWKYGMGPRRRPYVFVNGRWCESGRSWRR